MTITDSFSGASRDGLMATCPFCLRDVSEQPGSIYVSWECPCGARAAGASPHDLDDAADQLLHDLGLNLRASQPLIPVGESGMLHAQAFDVNRLKVQVQEQLARAGYDVRLVQLTPQSASPDARHALDVIWARKQVDLAPRPCLGIKIGWFALRTRDTAAVVEAFHVRQPRPARWEEGCSPPWQHVFITPHLGDWALVFGGVLSPYPSGEGYNWDEIAQMLTKLSARFGEAQYFYTNRVLEYHLYARAEAGRLVRGFGYFQDIVPRWIVGNPTPDEKTLGLRFDGEPCDEQDEVVDHPCEGDVFRLAGKWSVDPTQIDVDRAPGLGILGELPKHWSRL